MKCFFTFLFIIVLITVKAQYGTLDSTFGTNGKVVSNDFGRCNAIAVQPDQKLVAAGVGIFGEDTGFVVARYLPDGSLDNSFGKGGRTATGFGDVPLYLSSVCLLPDKRIVVSGFVRNDAVLVCYLPNGKADSSFGVNGIASLHIYNQNSFDDITVQPDSKIIAVGSTIDQTDIENWIVYNLIARYLPDGTLDMGFGKEGKTVNRPDSSTYNDCVTLQPDGKILTAAGGGGQADNLIYVARYNKDGSVDSPFGNKGNTLFSNNKNRVDINSVALQKDGKIVLTGTENLYNGPGETMMAVRLSADGSQDKTFGKDGMALAIFGENQSADGESMVVLPNDRIVVGGAVFPDDFSYSYNLFALVGFTADGKIDSSFGVSGTQQTDFPEQGYSFDLALQGDGKIVAAGVTAGGQTNFDGSFALARYNAAEDKVHHPLIAKIKRFLHNHGIGWKGGGSNISYYSVEKSSSAAGFREVARVSKNSTQNYSYIIPSSNNIISTTESYRIREISTTGESTYSNIITVNNTATVSIYPNPVKGILTINNLDITATSKITIADLSGTVWMTTVVRQQSTAKYDVSKLKPGTYVLTVTNGSISSDMKFVKE